MKNCIVLLCLQIILQVIDAQPAKNAEIAVDLKQNTESISPLIYGQFIEFLGRCIDGGIYDENSPLSDENGFRKDVLGKVEELKTPLLRFPGGTVVKIYNWKDGIGDKNIRPKRKNLIWGGVMDNHFGTAEFIQYCRAVHAEPFLVVNMATGSPMDASDWVEYCNGTGDTYWANLRRAQGFKDPFNVRYWGIGNEEYAVPDAGKHQNPDKYIEDSWQYIKLMKLQDPDIKITLVGNPDDLTWSRKIISAMNPVCDYLSVHFYLMPSDSTYQTLIRGVGRFDSQIDSLRHIIEGSPAEVISFPPWYRFPPRTGPVKIAIDEWGIWDINSGKGKGAYNLEYPYNWAQALAVGKFLNMFQRNADIIGLATWAQTVNVLAPIMTTTQGSYCQTVYTPLQAYRHYSQNNNLPVRINSPQSEDGLELIDGVASISDDDNVIVLSVLNLSENESIKTNINFIDKQNKKSELTDQITYTAPSLYSVNTSGKNLVKETKTDPNMNQEKGFHVILQPASINFLIFKRSNK